MSFDQVCPMLRTYFDDDACRKLQNQSIQVRQFAYNMAMAAIKMYPAYLKQSCPHPEVIRKVYSTTQKTQHEETLKQLKQYWVYLFTNYGVHFKREFKQNKYTPSMMGLNLITPQLFSELGMTFTSQELDYLFDSDYQHTSTIADDIEGSGNAFYGKGFTTDHYKNLSKDNQAKINGHHYLEDQKAVSTTYSNLFRQEIDESLKYIRRALEVAGGCPDEFDLHTVKSLEHLILFLENGNEEHFRDHSKEWLKMNNPNIEYTYGFIETYEDPMSMIGSFEADVTLKCLNIKTLLDLLPSFEKRFNLPEEWKRKLMTIPNAAVAHKVIGIGAHGPIEHAIAYCLPNYGDIRSEHGSKQVMYTLPPPIGDINTRRKVYLNEREIEIYDKYPLEISQQLKSKVFDLLVTLHETIGHASGNPHPDFDNIAGCWKNGLEEMRAEIIALYTAITFHDEIIESNILGEIGKIVSKEDLFHLYFMNIAGGYMRWRSVPKGDINITQAHTQADTGIMYYLIDNSNGLINLVQRTVQIDDTDIPAQSLDVLSLDIQCLDTAIKLTNELVHKVQYFKSTAPKKELDEFMTTYANSTRNANYSTIVHNMADFCNKGIKGNLYVFPEWPDENTPIAPTNSYKYFENLLELSGV